MKGCRPLSPEEVQQVRKQFTGVYKARNEALLIVGIKAGFRISELLSLTVGDVRQHGRVVDRVEVARRHMKGKGESRSVPLHPEARVYAQYDHDLVKTQKALGHKNINSTVSYLSFAESEVDAGILAA